MRHVRLVDELLRDTRYALRSFARAPAFTAAVLLTLALGIGINAAVFSVVYGVLFKPLPYPEPDRLVVVYDTQPPPMNCPTCPASYPEYVDWRDRNEVFEAIGASEPRRLVMTGRGDAEELPGAAVSASLFRVFGVGPQFGRWFTEEEDGPGGPNVAILSDRLWAGRFGRDPRVLGQTIVLNDTPRTIVGVMPKGFAHRGADLFVPLAERLDERMRNRHRFSVYGRLKAHITIDRARTEMIALGHRLARERNATHGIDVRAYHSVVVRPPNFLDPSRAKPADLLLVLQAAVIFVLLIACVNVANLQLARTAARRREIAVRTALGASPPRLARQFLTEGLLLPLAGGVLGLGLAYGAVRAFVTLAPPVLPRMATLGIDVPVLLFTLAVAIAAGVAFGLTPLLHVRRGSLGALTDSGSRLAGGTMSRRVGQALVVTTIALSVTLLVGAGLTVKGLWLLHRQDLGFQVDGILTFTASLPMSRYPSEDLARDFYARAIERLRAVPGVQRAGAINNLPLRPTHQNAFIEVEGKTLWEPENAPLVEQRFVTGDYHQVMSIPLVRGRHLTDADDERSKPVVLVNQRLADLCWPNEDPIGKRVRFGRPEWAEVVGVIADARILRPDETPPLEAASPHRQAPVSSLSFVLQTGTADPAALGNAIRREMAALDAELPLKNLATMETVASESLAQPKLISTLLSGFALLAAVLALVGVNGLMAYTISRQRYEYGIRLAMGASPGSLARMILARGGMLAAVGAGFGIVAALALTRVLAAWLYQVAPTDASVMAAACLVVVVAALAACIAPARTVARVDPVETLRAS